MHLITMPLFPILLAALCALVHSLGYDPAFLGNGYNVALPDFSPSLKSDVLTARDRPTTTFQAGFYTRYIHFSIATNKRRRQPIVVALNFDQTLRKSVPRTREWNIDTQVGAQYQLDNSYYRRNDYDRGHMAARAAASWGTTTAEAKQASDATFVYTNAALQHSELNQDEWLQLENWVRTLDIDANNRISIFQGPLYTTKPGAQKPFWGNPRVPLPTGFYKVVVFVDKQTNKIATRAFIMAQDSSTIDTPRKTPENFNRKLYRVSTAEVEKQTGLVFPKILKDSNPTKKPGTISAPVPMPKPTPSKPPTGEMPGTKPPSGGGQSGSCKRIVIYATMPNPFGRDEGKEWVSIRNLNWRSMNVNGWRLVDRVGRETRIYGLIVPGETRRFDNLDPFRLTNTGTTIALLDLNGNKVDEVSYSRSMVTAGQQIMFKMPTGQSKNCKGDLIHAAMPNPFGSDEGKEWVSIRNSMSTSMNVNGWRLRDRVGRETRIYGMIAPGQTRRYDNLAPFRLANSGSTIILVDLSGNVVDEVSYSRNMVSEGKQILFTV